MIEGKEVLSSNFVFFFQKSEMDSLSYLSGKPWRFKQDDEEVQNASLMSQMVKTPPAM